MKRGTTVKYGDPLALAARSTEDSKKKGRRRLYSDATLTWDHHDDGIVTDAYFSPKGAKVLVRSDMAMQESDKLASLFGSKGVVRILPDDEMPMTEDGMVAEVVISPASTVSRGNPSQLAALALGRLAKITGQVYKITDFEDIDDIPEYVNQELEKHGMSPDAAIIDRKTGKRICNADGSGSAVGNLWLMKLHHIAEAKVAGRGTVVGDPDLDMDSVGLPEERAWDVYRPYVMHRLTRRGIPWAHAASMIEGKKEIAKEALLAEMNERPVVMDRAPILYRWGMLAMKPRLVAGNSIRMNHFINKGFNLDADGDNMNFHVPKSKDAVKETLELMLPSKSLIQASDMKSAMPRMISESAGGLYLASLPPDKNQKSRTIWIN